MRDLNAGCRYVAWFAKPREVAKAVCRYVVGDASGHVFGSRAVGGVKGVASSVVKGVSEAEVTAVCLRFEVELDFSTHRGPNDSDVRDVRAARCRVRGGRGAAVAESDNDDDEGDGDGETNEPGPDPFRHFR